MRNTGTHLELTANSITISYNDEGPDAAPVIIFIHGFPFDKTMWDEQAKALSHKYRVISYDVRGHGKTTANDVQFSIDLFVADLIALMDELKIEKTILCGLSMGGYIALRAVELHPARVYALVLSDTQCLADDDEAKAKRIKAIELVKEKGVPHYAEESVKNLFAEESFNTKVDEINLIKETIKATSADTICKTIMALHNRTETCSNLYTVKIPVMIIVGEEDKITPPAAALLMHENITDSCLNYISHAGHLSNIENPYEFNFQLKKFLHRFAEVQEVSSQ